MRLEGLVLAIATAALIAAAGMARAAPTAERYRYEVSFDDRPIGTHSFEIDRSGDTKRVRSRADFHVKVMFVSLYRYEHAAEEHWQDGCLRRLDSKTDDNGRRYAVRIDGGNGALEVDRRAPEPGTELLDVDCAATFAYWDLAQLERTALLNSQTGALTPVTFRFDGDDNVAGEAARRYRLEPYGMDPILLWYRATDRRWLQLETRRAAGVLRYRLTGAEPLPAAGRGARGGIEGLPGGP